MARCLICGKELPPRTENEFHPFCSERCRLVDLGKWLGGTYRIAGPPASDSEIVEEVRRNRDDDEDDGSGTLH